MKIATYSDLHLEFARQQNRGYFSPPVDVDVLVLCGDTDTEGRDINYANVLADRFEHVIIVAGNHSYWGDNLHLLSDKWKNKAKDNVYPLFNDIKKIEDVVFVGGTLWTDFDDHSPFALLNWKKTMFPDSTYIKKGNDYRKITTDDLLNEHQRCKQVISSVLYGNGYDAMKKCVVTHHSPSFNFESKEFAGNASNVYYHSNMDDLILEADLWLFGHTHFPVDRTVGKCRCVSNPFGYGTDVVGFRDDLVIEL